MVLLVSYSQGGFIHLNCVTRGALSGQSGSCSSRTPSFQLARLQSPEFLRTLLIFECGGVFEISGFRRLSQAFETSRVACSRRHHWKMTPRARRSFLELSMFGRASVGLTRGAWFPEESIRRLVPSAQAVELIFSTISRNIVFPFSQWRE